MPRKLIISAIVIAAIVTAGVAWMALRLSPGAAPLPTLVPLSLPAGTPGAPDAAPTEISSEIASAPTLAVATAVPGPASTEPPPPATDIPAPTREATVTPDAAGTAAALDAAVQTAVAATLAAQPTLQPTPSAVPTLCPDTSPYRMDPARMAKLGCLSSDYVPSRFVVTQQFDNGIMIVFDDVSNSDFKKLNQKRKFYALANDGRAWRVYYDREDVPQTTSPNPADWYSCDKRAGRPETNGVPWRGFGLVWCGHRDIRTALGAVRRGAAEIKESAAFQSYYTGRVFTLNGRTFIVYLDWQDGVDDHYLRGTWEFR